MFDQETWRFINTFAPWLSAIATTAAVIISLYLARRSNRSEVGVTCAIVIPIGYRQMPEGSPEILRIGAVNQGARDVVIKGVMWRQQGLTRQSYVVIPPAAYASDRLPKRLLYGEEVQEFFPTETFSQSAETLLTRLRTSWFSSVTVRFLRAGFYSSTGEQYLGRLDKGARAWLLQRCAEPAGVKRAGGGNRG